MAKFKLIISDPDKGEAKSVEVEGPRAQTLIGLRIGEVMDGSIAGLSGHKLQITGGSDSDGTPMRPDIHGGVRASVILSGGVGYNPKQRGNRRRKKVRGNTITASIVQINMNIVGKTRMKLQKKG